jgi:hypothetical protein
LGLLIHLQPEKTDHTGLVDVKAENLGFYACSRFSRDNELDFVIQNFSPGKLDYQQHFEHGRPTKLILEQRKIQNTSKYCFILTILLSGDIHINPGPIQCPCTNCQKPVKSNQRAIQCDFCDHWTRLSCTTLSRPEYELLSTSDNTFYCYSCSQRLPNFPDYFFDTSVRNQSGNCTTDFNHTGSSQSGSSAFSDVNSDSEIENEHYDIFIELSELRKKHPNNFTCAYLNVNSIRYKFCSIRELLIKNTIV